VKALQYGSGGTVQAIEEAKAVLQTAWSIIFLHQFPNWIEYSGMGLAIIGVIVIVTQTKQEDKKTDDEK